MSQVNFITNLSLSETSGGGSGINYATYHQLKRFFEVNYIGPVKVPVQMRAHFVSKAKRMLGLKGEYFFFSDERLKRIAESVMKRLENNNADFNFFHGFTSWIGLDSNKPYFAYADACFATYVQIFNNAASFNARDLRRIYMREKEWLSKAKKVFFRTQWAIDETRKAYGIEGKNFRKAGLGGFIDIPEQDSYAGKRNILFISREFIPKGGLHCFLAFKTIYTKHSDTTLTIIGEKPPEEVLKHPGVHYEGYLRKNDPAEYTRFKELIASAFILIHPTIKDTNALVLTEAGYHGCPAIASDKFALPELIKNGETGFLIPTPIDAGDIITVILKLFGDPDYYYSIRKAVRSHSISNFTWEKVGDEFYKEIVEAG